MPLYVGKYAICTFLQNMRNMLRSHDRYKLVSLVSKRIPKIDRYLTKMWTKVWCFVVWLVVGVNFVCIQTALAMRLVYRCYTATEQRAWWSSVTARAASLTVMMHLHCARTHPSHCCGERWRLRHSKSECAWTFTDIPTIQLLAELFRISAVFPPFHVEFVKFRFSIPFIWAIKLRYFFFKKNTYHQRPSVKLKLHHNKNRLGLHPRPQWGSLQRSTTLPSWISIYRHFGPLLSALRASVVSDSFFWFSNVSMSAFIITDVQ